MGEWVRPSGCSTNECIEIGRAGLHLIAIRTSDMPEQWIYATHDEWRTFRAAVKAGEYDDVP